MVNQLAAAMGMGVYVMVVLYATKLPYRMMVDRGMEHIRAVYSRTFGTRWSVASF